MPHHPTGPDRAAAQLGLIKFGETDLAGILNQVIDVAARHLVGATEVSITIAGPGSAYTAAATGDMALRLDEAQYQQRTGPCLQAAGQRSTVLVPDTAHDRRWSPWPARAAQAGAGSVLSLALPILDVAGALNIYGRDAGVFDDTAVRAAEDFAGHASVTLSNAHMYDRTATLAQQMQSAMAHRAVIEQAKGIVMGEVRCSPDEAFAILTKISQDSNRKLRDVAATIVARAQVAPPAAANPERDPR